MARTQIPTTSPNGVRGTIIAIHQDEKGQAIGVTITWEGNRICRYGVNGHEPPQPTYRTLT